MLENPNGTFKPGQFARVEMPVAELDSALLVNRKAVLTDQDRRYVYVIDADNKVASRSVTTERAVGNKWLIADGLSEGDRLIVEGLQKIRPGAPVTPVKVDQKSAPQQAAQGDAAGGKDQAGAATAPGEESTESKESNAQ